MKEFEFIKTLRNSFGGVNACGIGDDAVLFGDNFLIAKDILVECIHFLPTTPIDLVIKKLFTSNISDISAMGGVAKSALIGVACSADKLGAISEAILKYAAFYNIKIIGGDTSKSKNGLFLSMTVIGVRGVSVLTRSGARQSDVIYLSRHSGLAKLSLEKELGLNNVGIDKYYHYSLTAETKAGKFLSEFSGVNSCCDLSDGLGRDLANIASESGLKAVLDLSSVDLGYLNEYGVDELDYFLSSGEEFALIFSVSQDRASLLEENFVNELGVKPVKIGKFVEGSGCFLACGNSEKDISDKGFQHFNFL